MASGSTSPPIKSTIPLRGGGGGGGGVQCNALLFPWTLIKPIVKMQLEVLKEDLFDIKKVYPCIYVIQYSVMQLLSNTKFKYGE